MSKMECVRKFWFCCGHRIVGHENKCANPHGHNYTLFVTAQADSLDNIGRIIDFALLKEKVETWIDQNWDHTFLIYKNDELLMPLKDHLSYNKQVFICDFNPTAENMASFLLHKIMPNILNGLGIKATKIELWESENNKVIASLC